jgi:hypothetical protein
MAHQLNAATLVLFLATNVLLLGVLGIDEGLGAAPAGFTHTDSGGGVTVNVTYLHPQGANEIRFEVVMDSHTVNLDAYDLKALSLLRDDTGKNYQPTRVDSKGSGHHREITIVFPKVSPPAKRLELVIKDLGRVKKRFFFWDLQ